MIKSYGQECNAYSPFIIAAARTNTIYNATSLDRNIHNSASQKFPRQAV